jgi:hypothetical protein
MSLLVPRLTERHKALVELTGSSALLENRIKPITDELNSYPLNINKKTWEKELQKADENASFLNLYCCELVKDDKFRPNSPADVQRALRIKKSDQDSLLELQNGRERPRGRRSRCPLPHF